MKNSVCHSSFRVPAAMLFGAAALLPALPLPAQSIALDAGFNAPKFTAAVQAARVVELSNGQFLAFSGYTDPFVGFDQISGVPTGNLIRCNANGSRDTSFQLDPVLRNQSITAVAPMTNGQYVVGTFLVAMSTSTSQVFRLNANGSLDASFVAGAGTTGLIRDVAVQADGKVLAGGTGVTSFNGVTDTDVLRLNTDGSVDTGFHPTLVNDPASPYGQVNFSDGITTDTGIQVQTDGKILIAGGFNTVNGVSVPSVARLLTDGTTDTSFAPSGFSIAQYHFPASSRAVRSVAIQPDGKIVLAGRFNATGSNVCQALVRLNSTGAIDGTFNAPSGGYDAFLIRLQPDGKVLESDIEAGVVRYDANGTLDTAFAANAQVGFANGIAVQANGQIVVAGGLGDTGVVRVNADGTADSTFSIGVPQADDVPGQLAVRADGTILAAGSFDTAGGQPRNGLALLNADGSLNAAAPATPFVATEGGPGLILQPDGKVLLYGPTLADDNGVPGFTYLRLNADLSADATLTADATVSTFGAVVYQPGGGYLVSPGVFDGGTYIQTTNGTANNPAFFLHRLTLAGAADPSFVPAIDPTTIFQDAGAGNGDNSTVAVGDDQALAIQPDGKILYKYFDLTSNYRLIRLNANGTLDSSFQPGTFAPGAGTYSGYTQSYDVGGGDEQANETEAASPGISGLIVQADGRLLIYGDFTKYDGQPYPGLSRLNADGTLDTTFNAGAGPQGTAAPSITGVQVQTDGKTLLVGDFQAFDGAARPGIARLNSDGTLDTMFTGAGIVHRQVSIGTSGLGAPGGQLVPEPDGNFLLTGNYETPAGAGSGSVLQLLASPLPTFFDGAVGLPGGFYYLAFGDGTSFGYYNLDLYPYLYHNDLGFEYVIDANDGRSGLFLYDFASGTFFYTSATLFPYLYDFTLNSFLYYYPDTKRPGSYTKNPRYFYDFAAGKIITK